MQALRREECQWDLKSCLCRFSWERLLNKWYGGMTWGVCRLVNWRVVDVKMQGTRLDSLQPRTSLIISWIKSFVGRLCKRCELSEPFAMGPLISFGYAMEAIAIDSVSWKQTLTYLFRQTYRKYCPIGEIEHIKDIYLSLVILVAKHWGPKLPKKYEIFYRTPLSMTPVSHLENLVQPLCKTSGCQYVPSHWNGHEKQQNKPIVTSAYQFTRL